MRARRSYIHHRADTQERSTTTTETTPTTKRISSSHFGVIPCGSPDNDRSPRAKKDTQNTTPDVYVVEDTYKHGRFCIGWTEEEGNPERERERGNEMKKDGWRDEEEKESK